MQKLRIGTVQWLRGGFFAGAAFVASPALADPPAMTYVSGPISVNQEQCIAIAQGAATALGATQQGGDSTFRWMARGDYSTQIVCDLPGRAVIVVAGPNGSNPSAELDAVKNFFLPRASGSASNGNGVAPNALAGIRPMPPLPSSVAEAFTMSTPASSRMVIGRWTDDGNCANSTTFSADGRFITPTGVRGTWTLMNERLTFQGTRTVTAIIRAIGNDRIILVHPNNSIGQSIRC